MKKKKNEKKMYDSIVILNYTHELSIRFQRKRRKKSELLQYKNFNN